MSDEPGERTSACPHSEAVGTRWDDPISEERQAELQGYLDRWQAETDHGERTGPFDTGRFELGVRLTGSDVFWLAQQSGYDEFGTLPNLHLEGTGLSGAHLEGADLYGAHLEGTLLGGAHLEGAGLSGAHLEGANLYGAHLEGANLYGAHLEGKRVPPDELKRLRQWQQNFPDVLSPADLRRAFLSPATTLDDVTLGDRDQGYVSVADVRWGSANLAVVRWAPRRTGKRRAGRQAITLGDERQARQARYHEGMLKNRETRLEDFEAAVRANRQLATVLRDQGLNEDADRFAYRAQLLQRIVLRRQGQGLRYLGSLLLGLIAGYGYRPLRSVGTYLLVVTLFGLAYWALGVQTGHTLTWNEAGVVSITAFHGRGFFATAFQPGDPQAAVAAVEAIIGLVIEITFIATFTQRFFAR